MLADRREFDVVIWGATGFTGRLVTAAIAGHTAPFYSCTLPNPGYSRGVRYALAGRSKEKLELLKAECKCGPDVGIFVAEAQDSSAIASFVSKAKVVIAVAGPFKLHSDVVVGQCAALGTHYVDITGEVAWVRSVIDRYDGLARANGALLCSMCGFDSVPFDLGALFAINRLRKRSSGSSIRRITSYTWMAEGSFSGGSLASGVSNSKTPVQLTQGLNQADPFLLGGLPKGGSRAEDLDSATHRIFQLSEDIYCGPSVMHVVNSRCVRRSAQLLSWGPYFNFSEFSPTFAQKQAHKLVTLQTNPAPPEIVEQLMAAGKLPKPGEGPKPEVRKRSKFAAVLNCTADDGSEIIVSVSGGEAGYEETARMVLEAALTLAEEPHSCPGIATGGCLTPAAALGESLIRRLQHVGLRFHVEEGQLAEVVRNHLQGKAVSQSKL
eukprot:TRINITY_DN64895_c0_g1_i1.p1 TRINITY_DN64895_c0_g1~~TRINITY_DN64895_c0_g1_i1.p1  ORF type:complete len:437 (+),score=72.29 TRINITY_DN64895_c0_g1_i1:32-1342(+)